MPIEALAELVAAGRDGGPSPRGQYSTRVLAGAARNRIELLRDTGTPIAVLEGKWLHTVAITFSASERWIAAAGFAGGVMVWDAATGAVVAHFPEMQADGGGAERLPLAFARGDGLLVCGGRQLAFVDTATWAVAATLAQPAAAIRAGQDPVRVTVFEPVNGWFCRWTINLKSFEIEGADRLRDTRVYCGMFGKDRAAS